MNMNSIHMLIWIYLLVSNSITLYGVPTHQELFLQANAAYQIHDYKKALELYEAIPNKGPVIWYNMGNCAYQLKCHSDAYVYWKKSEYGASWLLLQDAEYNIHQVKYGTSEKSLSLYERIQQNFNKYIRWSSLWWLQIGVAVIWWLFWLFYIYYRSRLLHGTFLLLICCCGIALKGKYADMRTKVGIITQAHAPLYVLPDRQFNHITMLDELAEVTILHSNKQSDWYKISYQDQIGWMPADSVASV